jgi:RecA-dependent nuclease
VSPAKRHMERVAAVGCVICRRLHGIYTPCQVHHVAEGSGLRSDFSVAGLCELHHTGSSGLHTLGTKRFCSLYRIPGETEYGLLVMVNEDLAKYEMRSIAA